LPDKLDEERYIQHKERTEKTLKKVVIFAAAIFVLIIIGAFFV
jgi:type IV secretory pathway component VirB8